jgi:fucose 4-O-acetylase-like acetyltransferase
MSLEELAEKTPASRDRYVDFLRAFSIATVVFGHWFIALIWWRNEAIGVYNAVGATSGLWLATWVLQVMPIFFFVGGFSNHKTYEAMKSRGEGYGDFMRARAARLLTPTAVFVGLWLVAQVIFHVVDVGSDRTIRLSFLPFGPLWFLFVYLGVIALTPLTLRLHARLGVWALVGFLAIALLGDVLRFNDIAPGFGWLNLAAVWLFAHQLGYFYADGSLVAAGPRAHALMAVAGLGALIVLTNVGIYPRSMVGTDVETVSNMNPPTLCIVALATWQIGAAMLLRDRVSRWLEKTRPWTAVIAANSMIMTVFLWHMTAYLIAILLLHPLGLGHPTDSTASWWLQRPLWIVAPAVLLAVFVAIFGRFERPRPSDRRPEAQSDATFPDAHKSHPATARMRGVP